MDLNDVKEARGILEQSIFKVVNDFEMMSGCIVETIGVKHKRIEAGIGSRDALDKITTRVVLPQNRESEED